MEDFTKVSSNIIDECKNITLKYLLGKIGRKNLVSIILTGSIARGSPSFKFVDGNLCLESDLDIVVVVNHKSVIKSLILIKYLARKLTFELKKKYSLISVSLSVTTEKSLNNSSPSIFYQDLALNGKSIFGKDVCSTLTRYDVKQIPHYDIYRLVMNRMVETLRVFVSSEDIEKKTIEGRFDSVLNSIVKLNFALIQAMLIKNDILIFRGCNFEDLKIGNAQQKYSEILSQLLTSYKELTELKESQQSFHHDMLEHFWLRVIQQFNFTIEKLSSIENISPLSIRKLLLEREKLSRRIQLSLIMFLQYFTISSPTNLFRAIVYILRFGSDRIYVPLYDLFLSSALLIKDIDENDRINPMCNNLKNLNNISSPKLWIKSFNAYFQLWKFIKE